VRSTGVSAARSNSLANICMLSSHQNKQVSDRRPSDYIAEMERALGDDFIPVLESSLIPREAVAALKADDYDGFLNLRGDHIANRIWQLAYGS